jgi:hypothetical protein
MNQHLAPIIAARALAALALGGCESIGANGIAASSSNASTPSIIACFIANSTVNFTLSSTDPNNSSIMPIQSTTGPMTYKGQAVMEQKLTYPRG